MIHPSRVTHRRRVGMRRVEAFDLGFWVSRKPLGVLVGLSGTTMPRFYGCHVPSWYKRMKRSIARAKERQALRMGRDPERERRCHRFDWW